MYKVIGVDQKEYGPITAEQMQQWIRDGRVNGQSLVWSEASGNWKPLSTYPEFAAFLPAATPPGAAFPGGATPMGGTMDRNAALEKVAGPATGLMVTAGLGLLLAAVGIVMNIAGIGLGAAGMGGNAQAPQWANLVGGTAGIIGNIIGIITSVVIFLGAMKMKKLESYSFALAASIIAIIPCVSPCCPIGIPMGIWALVVINKPEVKSQFR